MPPAASDKQRRAMGAALGAKRAGDCDKAKGPSKEMCKSMSERQLKDFAKKPKK